MFPRQQQKKIRERGQNKKKKFSLQRFCLGAATNQNENREPGNERVNQPVTRIVISRQKALEKKCKQTRARGGDVYGRRTRLNKNKAKRDERM